MTQERREIPARDEVVDPVTPSQAEGARDVVEAALHPERDVPTPSLETQPDAHRTPGQAEGSVELIEEELERD